MTYEESRKILKGDASGVEFMGEDVYKVCLALTSITEHECCSYGFDDECDWAEAYIVSYEDMIKR